MFDWKSPNAIIGYSVMGLVLLITVAVVFFGKGGNEALMLIIGNIMGFANAVVLFFYRKKPTENTKT
ncbi:MAG: hypothetical protein WC455_21625 [Dehalococcoidia bacterium]|jgi:hypothetical protein